MITKKKAIICVFTVFLIIIATTAYYLIPYVKTGNKLTVSFISTGKSDSIFIKLPNRKTMLIDGGYADSLPKIHDTLHKYRVSKINYLFTSHQHDDHIGAFENILKIYETDAVYMPQSPITNSQKNRFDRKISEKKIPVHNIKHGDVIINEDEIYAEVLSPFSEDIYGDENDYSAILYLSYKDTSFIFMGDASANIEGLLLNFYEDKLKEADVIKLGHHGSYTASTYPFLEKINPDYAVITTDGSDESVPSKRLADSLDKLKIKCYKTFETGNITFTSDGKTIDVETEK